MKRRFLTIPLFALAWHASAGAADLPSQVHPIDTRSDGVYGRLEGDVTLSAIALAELSEGGPAPGLRLAAHYYWMVGLTAGYVRPVSDDVPHHVLSAGVDVRPTFLPRWALDLQQGPSTLDLWLDSISLGVAANWAQPPAGDFGDSLALELSLGCGLPLSGKANGPWLDARGLMRVTDDGQARWAAQLGIGWYAPWTSPLVD
jgi:hypothetical protein